MMCRDKEGARQMDRNAGELGLLFEELYPWDTAQLDDLTEQTGQDRRSLLADLANSRLGNMEQKVAFILQKFPETRDSVVALVIRYWEKWQAITLEKWNRFDLDVLYELDNFETITRLGRHIQNTLRLYQGSQDIRAFRDSKQLEFSRYLAETREGDPETRFYLDETGNEPGKRYRGVAGICVTEWRQYAKFHAALSQWRGDQPWPQTLHFADVQDIQNHLHLLAQLSSRRAGLIFVGYSLAAGGNPHDVILSLFTQLVMDSLDKMGAEGGLSVPKGLVVVKEADAGFDHLHLHDLESDLAKHLERRFPGRVYLHGVRTVPKGREVLLEVADLIAAGMQRRALYGGRNAKDRLAEAVMNVTGFEDTTEPGMLYRAWPA